MSPIATTPATFQLSTAAPSVPLDPDSAGQSASTMPQYLVGTGGVVFAAVAIISVASYFQRGRKKANDSQKNGTWATFSKFLSPTRYRGGSDMATTSAGGDWPPDIEDSHEHVNQVYARSFHPTFWNLVESHPATTSAPAIYVEDEAEQIPASGAKPGTNTFTCAYLGDRGKDKSDNVLGALENAGQGASPQVKEASPYDRNLATHVRFRSEIIGTTDRPGGVFLVVPGEHAVGSSETSSGDDTFQVSPGSGITFDCPLYDKTVTGSENDYITSLYDQILTTTPKTFNGTFEPPPGPKTALIYSPYDGGVIDTELPYYRDQTDSAELRSPQHDGFTTTPPRSSSDSHEATPSLDSRCSPSAVTNPDWYISCLAYDGIQTTNTRRYGMADMGDIARTLKDQIPEEGYDLVRTMACRSGLCDLVDFRGADSEVDASTSYRHLDQLRPVDGKPRSSSCDIQDDCDDFRKIWANPETFRPLYESLDLLQRIVDGLGDSDTDCVSHSSSEYNNSEYSGDDGVDSDGVSPLTPTWAPDTPNQVSLGCASFASDEGSIYPVTPSQMSSALQPNPPGVFKHCNTSPITSGFNEEALIVAPVCSGLPLWSTSSVHADQLGVIEAFMELPVTSWFREGLQVAAPTYSGPPPSLQSKASGRTRGPDPLLTSYSPLQMFNTLRLGTTAAYTVSMESPWFDEEAQAIQLGSPHWSHSGTHRDPPMFQQYTHFWQ